MLLLTLALLGFTLSISCTELYLTRTAASLQAQASAPPFENSPFGFLPARVERAGYPDSGFVDAQYIGVRWHRSEVPVWWFLVQPDLNNPTYDWALYDDTLGAVPEGVHTLANISADHWLQRHGYALPGSYLPVDVEQYRRFVRATVERYDGDGVDDMPGLENPVMYWQVDNEPKAHLSGFAELQRITYRGSGLGSPSRASASRPGITLSASSIRSPGVRKRSSLLLA